MMRDTEMDRICAGDPCSQTKYRKAIEKRFCLIKKKVPRAGKLLDVGCGFGSYPLAEVADVVVGVDINRDYLLLASSSGVAAIQSDAELLALKDRVFDAVTCIETIEHIPGDERALCEFWRVLKPGGVLVITAPNSLFPSETHVVRISGESMGISPLRRLRVIPRGFRNTVKLARDYRLSEVRSMMVRNGFKIAEVTYLMPTFEHTNIPFLSLFQRICSIGERVPIMRNFAMTIVIVALREAVPIARTSP